MNQKPVFSQQSSKLRRNSAGFTLIELLAVIAIVVVMMTMGAMGIRNLTTGKGTSTGLPNAEAVFAEARAMAVGKGVKTRVMVDCIDNKDTANYKRRIMIAVQTTDKNGKVDGDNWQVESRGYTLPEGTFFSEELTVKNASANGTLDKKEYTFSGKPKDNGKYIAYEFNAQGQCTMPGVSFIIGAGARGVGQEPRVVGNAKRDFAGFTIWQNGQTAIIRDMDQIVPKGQTITEF